MMIFAVIPFFGQWAMYSHKKQLEEDYSQRLEAAKEAEADNDREQSGVPTKDNGVRSEISDRSTKEDNVPRTAGGSDASQVKPAVHTVSVSPVKEEAACTVDQTVVSDPAPATDAVPVHVHNWQPITQTVHHDATGHMETVVISPAYDEEVVVGYVCECGERK